MEIRRTGLWWSTQPLLPLMLALLRTNQVPWLYLACQVRENGTEAGAQDLECAGRGQDGGRCAGQHSLLSVLGLSDQYH